MVGAPEAILIIDADARRRAFARDVLDRAGYDVRAAADEGQAAGLVAGWRPAAVVAAAPPIFAALASCPVVVLATPGAPPPADARVVATAVPFDRADLLAAVWVALNP
jgi:CheY-like chemotaxis protein